MRTHWSAGESSFFFLLSSFFFLPSLLFRKKRLTELLNIAIGFYVDKVANFKLNDAKALQRAKQLRVKAKAKICKDGGVMSEREARKEMKREQKEKERSEKLEKMNPVARAKFLEKEEERTRKRRMKRAGGKMTVAR